MTPQNLKYILDVIVLFLGFYVMIQIIKSSLGGNVGSAFRIILTGVFILAANHLLDTFYLAEMLKSAGHTSDFWQSSIVHREINLMGFAIMAWGFLKLTRISLPNI